MHREHAQLCQPNQGDSFHHYIGELCSYIIEKSFLVDVHSFRRGKTNDYARSARPSILQLLREGPAACLPAEGGDSSTDSTTQALSSESLETMSSGRLRWIHIPCNNMSWVPDVLQAVANESSRASRNGDRANLENTLLNWECWQSKQNSPRHRWAHAHFLEPHCQIFPPDDVTNTSNDMQLLLYVSQIRLLPVLKFLG